MAPHLLVSQARHALAATFAQLPIGSSVLLAVSGGADSMALAASASYAARSRAIQLFALTVDHGLRPESAVEAQQVQGWLRQLGIDARVAKLHGLGAELREGTQNGRDEARLGPEGAARRARYQALAAIARELAASGNSGSGGGIAAALPVLLGHNADDQAETVVLGFGRGSGARSIAGMPREGWLPEMGVEQQVRMYRPLLDMRHAQLCKVCEELGVPWVEDPTNDLASKWRAADGSALRRSAVRHRVIPLLEEVLGPGVTEALARTAALLQSDQEALECWASEACAQASATAATASRDSEAVRLCAKVLRSYPKSVRDRAARRAVAQAGGRIGELNYEHTGELDKLITGRENNKWLALPGAHVWKHDGWLRFLQGPLPPQPDRRDSIEGEN